MTGASRSRRTLLAAVTTLGAGAVWSLHLVGSYAIVSLACVADWQRPVAMVTLLTIACLIVALVCGVVAHRRRRSADADLMLVGVLAAAVFAAAIVLQGVVAWFLPLCQAAP